MNKVLEFWNEQAKKYRDSPYATTPDLLASELEMNEILKYLEDGKRVLDIGCGNGVKDIEFCRRKRIDLKGIDYSEEMIAMANDMLKKAEGLIGNLEFACGDVLNLEESNKYDLIITDRCLINLHGHAEHLKAIDNIYELLNDRGIHLMMECTKAGLARINEVRQVFGLESIKERWHNNYLDEQKVLQHVTAKFKNVYVNNFDSMYFLISRTINALLTPEGQEIDYNSKVNQIAVKLPPAGDFAPLKLFVLKK